MKTNSQSTVIIVSLLLFLFAAIVYAEDACIQLCKEKNRQAVALCNMPEKTPQEVKSCLQTVRNNFDACMQACGK